MEINQPFNIILVDDHILLRDALAGLIDSFEEFKITGVAENGQELIQVIKEAGAPDLIILDLHMPVMDGYEAAGWIHTNLPQVKILILTMFDSEIALIRLLKVGVRGFLKKDIHPEELKKALLAVAGNGYYYSHSATGKLASFFQRSFNNKLSLERGMLTESELKFLKLVSTEMTYKEIASIMKMTPRAIDGYRDSLFEKLDVKSRVGLAIYAVKNGIVTF